MEAFAAAAGMPFAEWYRNQLRREMKQAGFAPPGERTSWPSVIGILALTLGGSLWLALAMAVAVGVALSMLHGYACVSHRGDQVVLGMAITMTAAGLTVVLGIAWFAQGGQTPPLPDTVRLGVPWPALVEALRALPGVGPKAAQRMAYAGAAIEHGWSRNVLNIHIETGLLARTAMAVIRREICVEE